MVALDSQRHLKATYNGVFSLEGRLPVPHYTVPLLFGLVYSFVKVTGAWPHPWSSSIAGIDDMARLAQARDLASGQGWFDLLQTRLDAPDGIWMHWSRLVDAPLAGLMWLGDIFGKGEAVALIFWPVLLGIVFFVLIAQITRALIGDRGIFFSLFAALFFASTLRTFSPGRIDHHNLQIVLTAALLLCVLRLPDGRRWGLAAGIAAAVSVGIGIETLPLVGIAGVIIAGLWLFDPHRYAGPTAAFGLSFSLSTALVYAISAPPSRYLLTQCDSISMTHVGTATIGGAGIALICRLVPQNSSWVQRVAALAGLGVICGGVAVTFFSHCLGDPYAFLQPELRTVWLDHVSEARSALVVWNEQPKVFLAAFVPLAVLACVGIYAYGRSSADQRVKWIILGLFAAVATLVSLEQVRFVQFAHMFCIPGAAWVMVRCFDAISTRGLTLGRAVLLIAAPVLTSPWIVVLANLFIVSPLLSHKAEGAETGRPVISGIERECQDEASIRLMASLEPGTAATPIFFGSTVVGRTELSVLAAPYHRAQNAILDAHRIFAGSPEAAKAILERRNIDYVLLCTTSTVRLITGEKYPDSLTALLESDTPPTWLDQVASDDATNLHAYRVVTNQD